MVYGRVWGRGRFLEERFLPHLDEDDQAAGSDVWKLHLQDFLAMESLGKKVQEVKGKCEFEECPVVSWKIFDGR